MGRHGEAVGGELIRWLGVNGWRRGGQGVLIDNLIAAERHGGRAELNGGRGGQRVSQGLEVGARPRRGLCDLRWTTA